MNYPPLFSRFFPLLLGVFLLIPTLAGCGKFLDPGPPLPQVLLNPELPGPATDTAMPLQVLVTRPEAGSDINTDRIAALFDGLKVKYLTSARWASPAPGMLQRLMVDSLESSKCFSGVGDEASGLTSQLRLSMDIKRFYLRYDAGAKPVVDIAVTLRLVNLQTGSSLGFTRIETTQAAQSEDLRDLIDAFNAATGRVLKQSSAWVLERAALSAAR